jgi:hypothetical protein
VRAFENDENVGKQNAGDYHHGNDFKPEVCRFVHNASQSKGRQGYLAV